MTISWGPVVPTDSTPLGDLQSPIRVNYRDKTKGRQGSLGPVRHCQDRVAATKAVLDILEPHSAMLISSIESVLAYNTAGYDPLNVPPDPGADNPAVTFTFRVRPDNAPPYTDKIYLPAVKNLDTYSQKETIGQALGVALQNHMPSGYQVQFLG